MQDKPRRAAAWLALFLLCGPTAATGHAEPEGRVRFYNIADSDFDAYSRSPTPQQQAWMRRHYARMQTYSPYFDQRLAWYPGAWAYKDSYAIKPQWPEFREHPDWILRDGTGRPLFIPWGCSEGRCPQYAGDVGNPAFRAHWIAAASRLIQRGYRGLWVDDVNLTWRVGDGLGRPVRPLDPRTGRPMRLQDWRRYFALFMEEIRAALPQAEIAHNVIWYAGPPTDAWIRRQIDAADYINLERGASDPGLTGGDGPWSFRRFLEFIDFVHQRGRAVILMDYGDDLPAREFGLAAWLLISHGRDLLSSNQLAWTAPDRFWHGYALDLGHAQGPRSRWRGLYRRDFDCGYVLLNPPGGAPAAISLPPGQRRLDAGAQRSFVLRARGAAVVLLDCARSAGPLR